MRILHEKLIVAHRFPAVNGARSFNTVFTWARQQTVFRATWMQSLPSPINSLSSAKDSVKVQHPWCHFVPPPTTKPGTATCRPCTTAYSTYSKRETKSCIRNLRTRREVAKRGPLNMEMDRCWSNYIIQTNFRVDPWVTNLTKTRLIISDMQVAKDRKYKCGRTDISSSFCVCSTLTLHKELT
jgi:hypothetical protein